MEWDERDDEPVAYRSPLHPDDRLWRHPSELAWASDPQPRRPAAAWTSMLGAATLGAVLALASVVAVAALVGQGSSGSARAALVGTPATVAAAFRELTADGADGGPSVVGLAVQTLEGSHVASAVAVIDPDVLVTDASVLAGATLVEAVALDGSRKVAAVAGIDAATGIAVLRIEGGGFTPLEVGAPRTLVAGTGVDFVTAGQGTTATIPARIVSVARAVQDPAGEWRPAMMESAVARVPFGWSGGALVDREGRLVGVASNIVQEADGGGPEDRRAYFTPADVAARVAAAAVAGRPTPVWMGVEGSDVSADQVATLGTAGALLRAVAPGGPAAVAGLLPGDVVVAMGDEPVRSMQELIAIVRTRDPGDSVTVVVHRGEARSAHRVVLASPS